ncbi:MAG: lytic murein transglycosylase [Candidatus Electrothrix sp. AR4]|nr:lytic murein transglycosylase [Candidatus Electrothrix sp. AR4]
MTTLKNIIPVFFFAFFLQVPENIQSTIFNKKISHEKALSFSKQAYAQSKQDVVTLTKKEKRKNETGKRGIFNQSAICLQPADISEQANHHTFSSFKKWLSSFKKEAKKKGISHNTVHAAFKKVQFIEKVIQLDRKQAEYSLSFTNYINNSISSSRIKRGKRKIQENAKILQRIQDKYGVPPQILVALWGLESDFGGFTGNFSTVNTLATLAYEGRRRNFFTNELFCALAMLDSGNITVQEMTGSWAGAMGQPQFMPSTFYYYAVDGNGDGKKDLWKNTNDVLSSAANYLSQSKWRTGEKWGVEVILPKNFDPYQAQLSVEKTLQKWKSLGVKKSNGKKLRGTTLKGSILLPSGLSGPAFLVFHNFRVIREWNKSVNYALAVGHLSDRIAGSAPLVGLNKQRDKNLSRQDALLIQNILSSLGYYKDTIDGMVGLKSREAIREYQKDKGLPADGYPSDDLIMQLKQERL